MKFGVKYDELSRRGDCLFQQIFLSFKVWLVKYNTAAAAATCVTTFTPAIQAKLCRPEVAFLQDDLYAIWLAGQRMMCEEYHGLRYPISKHSIPHHRLLSSRSKIHPLRYESISSKCCLASRVVESEDSFCIGKPRIENGNRCIPDFLMKVFRCPPTIMVLAGICDYAGLFWKIAVLKLLFFAQS